MAYYRMDIYTSESHLENAMRNILWDFEVQTF